MILTTQFRAWWARSQSINQAMNHPHIAICLGHSRRINGRPEGGAVSHDGKLSEWNYNLPLAILIRQELKQHGVRAEIISEYEGTSYGAAQRWLAGKLRELGVTCAVELHFNAADDSAANGHEWLAWHSSANGKYLANCLHLAMCQEVPGLKSRGVKPKDASARGAEFLKGTHCPAVIAEPFFGSSPHDWAIANQEREQIAKAYAAGILEFLK